MNQTEKQKYPLMRFFPHLILLFMAIAFIGFAGECAVRHTIAKPAIAEPSR